MQSESGLVEAGSRPSCKWTFKGQGEIYSIPAGAFPLQEEECNQAFAKWAQANSGGTADL